VTADDIELLYARLDERLKAIEREVVDVRAHQTLAARDLAAARPQWPAIVASAASVVALIITLAMNL
jgi:hypothetical protein